MPPRKRSTRVITQEQAAAILEQEQSELALKAYRLKQAGKSWWEIAEELQITEQAAALSVSQAMTRAVELVSSVTKRQLLVLEVDRMDTLMASHWKQATEHFTKIDKDGNPNLEPPDIRAAEFVLKTIKERAALLQLDEAQTTTVQTVVVQGSSEQYIAALRLIASRGEIVDGEVVEDAS